MLECAKAARPFGTFSILLVQNGRVVHRISYYQNFINSIFFIKEYYCEIFYCGCLQHRQKDLE